ncbi:MAG: hypothetical protein ACRYFX_26905 [Janthinobacterium lividum]
MANVVSLSSPLFSKVSFPDLSLEQQAKLYYLVFTDRPTKPDCVCTHLTDAKSFLNWHPEWNDPEGTTERIGRAGLFGAEVL